MKLMHVIANLPLIMIASQAQGIVPLDAAGRSGFVTVKVVDQFGRQVQNPTMSVRVQSSAAVGALGSVVAWKNGDSLKFGSYILTIEAAGYARVEESLIVKEAISVLTICTRFGPGEVENVVIIALHLTDSDCKNARLLAVFDQASTVSRETYLVSNNSVYLKHVPSGDYVLVLLAESRVCLAAPLRISGEPVQRFRVPQIPGQNQ
jgi:hypothetical protein